MPMCLMAKPTFEWARSTAQVPVGTTVGAMLVVVMKSAPVRWVDK